MYWVVCFLCCIKYNLLEFCTRNVLTKKHCLGLKNKKTRRTLTPKKSMKSFAGLRGRAEGFHENKLRLYFLDVVGGEREGKKMVCSLKLTYGFGHFFPESFRLKFSLFLTRHNISLETCTTNFIGDLPKDFFHLQNL